MDGQYFRQGELFGYVLDRHQFIARVAHELAHNASLRASATAQGRLNVARRFGTETVANAFVGALEPLLRSLAP